MAARNAMRQFVTGVKDKMAAMVFFVWSPPINPKPDQSLLFH
jgi:hypothetical protein